MSIGPDVDQPPIEAELGRRASGAVAWSFVNTVVSKFGTLLIGILLARLLGPAEFGTYAVATVAMVAVLSFNELGVSLAIVRWPGDPRVIASTVTTISVVSSAVLVAASCAAAPWFAASMGDPGATDIVRLMSVAILVNGIVATPAALLQRELRQRRRMVIDQVNTWLGAVVSLLLALTGLGALSLAIGRLAGSIVSAVLFIRASPLPLRFGFRREAAGDLLRFGLPLAGTSAIVFASGYADQLVAGQTLGAVALGFYVLAFNLSSWPVTMFSQPLRNVAPAVFARMQHTPAESGRAFVLVVGLLACVALPVCAVLATTARPLVQVVYGSVWAPAAAVLGWLGVMAAFRICFEAAYDFLVVQGVSRQLLVLQAVWLAATVPALFLGARSYGLAGIAAVQPVVALLVVTPFYAVLLRRCGVSLRLLVGRLWLPVLAAGAVAGAAALIGRTGLPALGTCAVAGGVGLLAIMALLASRRAEVSQLRRLQGAAPVEPVDA